MYTKVKEELADGLMELKSGLLSCFDESIHGLEDLKEDNLKSKQVVKIYRMKIESILSDLDSTPDMLVGLKAIVGTPTVKSNISSLVSE